jgi:hypothetical protein
MEHPLQQPFNPETFQNLAGVRRIEKTVWNKATGISSLIKFYRMPPTTHNGIIMTYR